MQPIHIFTSITANYLPKARVLATSVKRFHPDAKFHLMLSDVIPQSIAIENEPFDSIITIDELPIPEQKAWIFKHSIVEMCTGVKPIAFQEIFQRYNCDKVIYLDPDIAVLNPLDSITEKLDYYSVLLTPHQTSPEESNEAVLDNELCSLRHGVYNLGFLAVRNSQDGRAFLKWWSKRCLDFCYDNIPQGMFTDQRWVDLAPAFFTDIHILRKPIYNVATWNLTHRKVTGSLEEGILVNGEPICFYHFSGFDSGAQELMLKKYGSSSKVLFNLREWYIAQCEEMGQSIFGKIPCVYSYFENSELITKEQRLLYRDRIDLQQAYPDPFSTEKTPDHSYLNWYTYHRDYEPGNQHKNSLYNQQSLLKVKAELEEAKALIRGMESSKFWKMRTAWFKLKELPQLILKKSNTSSIELKKKSSEIKKPISSLDVGLKVYNPQPYSIQKDLFLLSGKVEDDNFDISNANIEISFNGKKSTSIRLDNGSFEANINTFLLANGENTIEIKLINSLGKQIAKTQVNFKVNNVGNLAESVSKYMKDSASKIIIEGLIDSCDFPFKNCDIIPWFDRNNATDYIPGIIEKYSLAQEFIKHFTDFVNLGYINLDSFIPKELIEKANSEIEILISEGSVSYVNESGDRIEHLFEKSEAVNKIWNYPSIIRILSALFDDVALPCQTLNFIHGSQQEVHQDTIHLTPFPEGYMCGVWIALEDISPDSGPLFVYPKSHKLPALYAKSVGINKASNSLNQHLLNEYAQKYLPALKSHLSEFNLEPMIYTPKAGSVFIWHANLAHGGSGRKVKNLTRKSMVSHYFSSGAIAFYDTTGKIGHKRNPVLG